MANKSGLQVAGNLAHLAKALYDIIRAFMQGGWAAAALQALKHYWPQILTVALILTLLPIIIFCCLPMMLFGYDSSTDTEISAMTVQANTVSRYYDNYESYIDDWVENIKSTVINSEGQDTEINGTTSETESMESVEYEVVFTGSKIQKNWYVALHAVTVENNLAGATEDSIRNFATNCMTYTIEQAEENTEGNDTVETLDDTTARKQILNIRFLTPYEIMDKCNYSDSDNNWARLIYKTLEGGVNSSVGQLGSLFSDASWRNNITSNYGYRTDPYVGFHHGLDIGMPMGTEICAVRDGTVVSVVYSTTGYGYHVVLEHENGVETLYAHCSEILVTNGQTVSKGTVIAKVGSTGNSTGPHCHFEVRINGEQVDPSPYLP